MEEKLSEIGRFLKKKHREKHHANDQLGVLSGLSGLALFHFYYAKFLNTDEHANIGLKILSLCLKKINNEYNYPTYCTGLVGMAWVFNHLEQENFVDLDEGLLNNLDDPLYNIMVANMKSENYDFLHGAIGYGFYFLKRYQNTNSDKLKNKYRDYLFSLIGLLDDATERKGNKTKWISIIDKKTNIKGYNLSLAHGISSIVNFLSRLYGYDDFNNRVESMLKGGIDYILSFKNENERSFSLFPNYIIKGTDVHWESRVAWCYGDLGIGLSLWHASNSLGDNKLRNTAINIFNHVAQRTSSKNSGVIDAGICHGSFGNAQIFNYIYKETKEEIFRVAGSFWMQDGLRKAMHKTGYCGYKQWGGNDQKWQNELFLLEGVSGIGLCLLSHLSKFETNWDECLMIS